MYCIGPKADVIHCLGDKKTEARTAMIAIAAGIPVMGLFGIKTAIPYYLEILSHPEFCAGVFNTAFSKNIPNSSIIQINGPKWRGCA